LGLLRFVEEGSVSPWVYLEAFKMLPKGWSPSWYGVKDRFDALMRRPDFASKCLQGEFARLKEVAIKGQLPWPGTLVREVLPFYKGKVPPIEYFQALLATYRIAMASDEAKSMDDDDDDDVVTFLMAKEAIFKVWPDVLKGWGIDLRGVFPCVSPERKCFLELGALLGQRGDRLKPESISSPNASNASKSTPSTKTEPY